VLCGVRKNLRDCQFRNNRALADGGAIYVEGDSGKVVATNCTFHGNEIKLDYNVTTGNSRGGAIRGNVEATDCKFTANTVSVQNFYQGIESAGFGGAIAGAVKAVRCDFTDNWVYAYSSDGVKPTVDGGAIYGNFTGTQCVFKHNEAFATEDKGFCSGGAISGEIVKAFNCTFFENSSGTGIEEEESITNGGGGAVFTSVGESSLANCLFIRNSSEFRGGAVQGGTDREKDSIYISNCTFLDNSVADEGKGAALSCGGIVRSLNNIFWFSSANEIGIVRDNLIYVCFAGTFRNADENYPAPSSATPNLIKGGMSALTNGIIADIYLVSPSILFLDADPMFVNVADPDGADNKWGTADDGLRLQAGSPAIGKALDPRVSGFVDVRPIDVADADMDGNLTEKLPVDIIGSVRVQNNFVEIGAYEFGNLANVAEISVFADKTDLTDGGTRSFGNVPRRDRKTLSFTIKSVGTNGLQNIAVTLEGAKEITLEKATYTTLEPGSTATVSVTFKPKSVGKFSAKLRILSSDPNESPFDITLTGKGVDKKSKGKSKSKSKTKASDVITGSFPTSIWSSFSSAATDNEEAVSGTVSSDAGKFLVLTIAKTPGASTGTVEVSSDLVNWFSGPDHTTVLIDDSSILKVRDNTPMLGQKRYIRLK
jgi:predicted outer membrane repeat protein